LPVGGIKEKTIAAARAGIKRVVLPARNRRDLDDIPPSTRALLDFVWVEHVHQALEVALGLSSAGEASAANDSPSNRDPEARSVALTKNPPEAAAGPAQ